jgi:hypothetical protein
MPLADANREVDSWPVAMPVKRGVIDGVCIAAAIDKPGRIRSDATTLLARDGPRRAPEPR